MNARYGLIPRPSGRGARQSNEFGETVRWSFLGIADLRVALADTLEPGVGLYSRSFSDLDDYRNLYSIPFINHDPADEL